MPYASVEKIEMSVTGLLDVKKEHKSPRKEVTLWNGVAVSSQFLGQVVVNVSKLKPFAGIQVQQAFNIKGI
jgi:hypothetical protein